MTHNPSSEPAAAGSAPGDEDRRRSVSVVIGELIARRSAGDSITDGDVIEQHPELMPELAEALQVVRQVETARVQAQLEGPADRPSTILSDSALEAPLSDDDLADDDLPSIEGYRIVRRLRRGGQGTVYYGFKTAINRPVAVKVLWGARHAGAIHTGRFGREVDILGSLDHPNIVGIIDRGELPDGSLYLTMEYVDGRPLDQHVEQLRKDHPGDRTRILSLFVRICQAVNAAHVRGIVHRDLKPSNILIDTYGEPKVLDFGLAALATAPVGGAPATVRTQTGQFLGSLPWASPEQVDAEQVDARSDVYALGLLLYHMLCGRFPYSVEGRFSQVVHNVVHSQPAPLRWPDDVSGRQVNADPALNDIVMRALAKSPQQRYQSAGEFADACDRYLQDGPRRAARSGLSRPLKWLAACAAMLLIAVIIAAVWQRGQQAPPGAQAQPPTPTPTPTAHIPDVVVDEWAVQDSTVTRLGPLGNGTSAHFKDLPQPYLPLVGLHLTYGQFGNSIIVKTIQPIYRGQDARQFGPTYGVHSIHTDRSDTIMAPQGYAIGGLEIRYGLRIDSIRPVFMPLVNGRLNPAQATKGEPYGGSTGGAPELLSSQGGLVVGICGMHGEDLDRLGLYIKE